MMAVWSFGSYGIGPRRGVCQWYRRVNARTRARKERIMPKIRHLAVICMDPEKLAKFYCDVFEMEVVARSESRNNVFLTDGYMNLALLSQKAEGKQNGLNHFGFHVEDSDVIAERLKDWDIVGPSQRPPARVYAEQ